VGGGRGESRVLGLVGEVVDDCVEGGSSDGVA
jgi:hypothetical protein